MLVVVIPIFRPPLMRRRGPTLGIVILRKSRDQQYLTRRWRKFQKVKYDKPEERCAHRNWLWLVEHCWTLPPDLTLTQLPDDFFYAQLLVPMVDGTHGLVLHSIKHEISEPKHDALLLLQHISLSDSARIATVVFATRLFNAPVYAMPRGIPLWPLTCFRNDVWKIGINVSETVQIGQSRREGFSDCRLGWLGSGARGPSPHRVAACCAWWPGHVEESQTQLVILWCVKNFIAPVTLISRKVVPWLVSG